MRSQVPDQDHDAALLARDDLHCFLHERFALEIAQVIAVTGDSAYDYDGVVALGCVIRGQTSHYDIVVNNANHWLYEAAAEAMLPVGNGILTVDTKDQALARARGGIDGKGGDAARACLRLIEIRRKFEERQT